METSGHAGELRLCFEGHKEAPKVLIREVTCSKHCFGKMNLPATSEEASAPVQETCWD